MGFKVDQEDYFGLPLSLFLGYHHLEIATVKFPGVEGTLLVRLTCFFFVFFFLWYHVKYSVVFTYLLAFKQDFQGRLVTPFNATSSLAALVWLAQLWRLMCSYLFQSLGCSVVIWLLVKTPSKKVGVNWWSSVVARIVVRMPVVTILSICVRNMGSGLFPVSRTTAVILWLEWKEH